MLKIFVKFLKFLTIVLQSMLVFSCSNNNDTVLAKVGKFEINGSSFMERLKVVRDKLSLPDNGEVRKNFLKSFIDEQVLLSEAENLGYSSDSAAISELNSIKLQRLLSLYQEEEVYNSVNISDDDLKKHFAKLSIKLKLRHLYADNKKTADSLSFLVYNGVPFEKLAREVFNDPLLKETGGDLGYVAFDEMQIDFADAAYKLKIGEISKPVKTNYGYSIIRVDDRIGNPLLTETEYLKQKSAIAESYYKYAKKRVAKEYAAAIQTDVKINEEVFDKLYENFRPKLSSQNINEKGNKTSSVPDDAILLTSNIGAWDVKTFKQKAAFTSEGQRDWIRNKEFFKEYINGLVTRERIVQLAKEKNYDKSEEYLAAVQKDFKRYQIERLKNDIFASISTPEDSLVNFYNINKSTFIIPARVNLREIVLDKPENIKIVKKLINQGKSFESIAKEYSINKHTAVFGGEMGFINYSELGPFAEEVKKLNPGEWTGPFKRSNVYFFLQCIEQQQSKFKSYPEAKEEVIAKYKTMHFDLAMQDRISDIKSRTKIVSYPEKLYSLKYN